MLIRNSLAWVAVGLRELNEANILERIFAVSAYLLGLGLFWRACSVVGGGVAWVGGGVAWAFGSGGKSWFEGGVGWLWRVHGLVGGGGLLRMINLGQPR